MDRAIYASKSSSRRTLSIRFGNIPVYCRQYVIDTVAAFDMDCTGYLKEADLVKLLEALQIPQEILIVQVFIDNYPKSVSSKVFGYLAIFQKSLLIFILSLSIFTVFQGPVEMFDVKYCSETIFKAINNWFIDGVEHYVSYLFPYTSSFMLF